MAFFAGLLAFGLFFLSDWNDWKRGWRALRWCFPAGAVLLTGATACLSMKGRSPLPGAARWVFFALAAAFLALLLYTLFFALSAKEAYAAQGRMRRACTVGVYALCRHPGVLWLAGTHLCLWAAAGLPLSAVVSYTALNLLLVWFEDACVFPARLEGYAQYRRVTPFLLPDRASIRALMASF